MNINTGVLMPESQGMSMGEGAPIMQGVIRIKRY